MVRTEESKTATPYGTSNADTLHIQNQMPSLTGSTRSRPPAPCTKSIRRVLPCDRCSIHVSSFLYHSVQAQGPLVFYAYDIGTQIIRTRLKGRHEPVPWKWGDVNACNGYYPVVTYNIFLVPAQHRIALNILDLSAYHHSPHKAAPGVDRFAVL